MSVETLDESVRKRAVTARKSKGWSQARLAEEAGISENTVIAFEKGKKDTQSGKLRAILDALGMEPVPDHTINLDGISGDARMFLKVAAQRLRVMDEETQRRVLTDLYPRLLGDS